MIFSFMNIWINPKSILNGFLSLRHSQNSAEIMAESFPSCCRIVFSHLYATDSANL